jgi:hypothetical protein
MDKPDGGIPLIKLKTTNLLSYVTDSHGAIAFYETGFSKKMVPMSEPGMIWLDGFFTVEDSAGQQHMLAIFARMKKPC